jgi:very-short-patch-repair endonuclease
MKQVTNKGKTLSKSKASKTRKKNTVHRHPKFGTSKLEEDFAKNFLDKLGIKYIYQFEAANIHRFYDFKIVDGPIIEIQGSYWHGDPRIYEEKDLNKTQIRAQRIDEYKQKWALMHGIPIYYIWEKDIRENPDLVMEQLKKILHIMEEKKNKSKRHKNIIK